jgi:enoyl-CoA hydratase/carnithine racemase
MSDPEPPVLTERMGAVRRLTLNRPRFHNPLTPRCIRELLAGVDEAARDREVRVVVIRGSGRPSRPATASCPRTSSRATPTAAPASRGT